MVKWVRMVVMESGICRWGRIGGASGSVTWGKAGFWRDSELGLAEGGNRLRLGDEEAVGGDATGLYGGGIHAIRGLHNDRGRIPA